MSSDIKKGKHPNSIANLKAGSKSTSKNTRHGYAKLAQITARMMLQKFTMRQLMLYTGISKTSAYNWIHAMHDAGCIHIVDYARGRKHSLGAAVYAWGSGDDVERPTPASSTERSRSSKQRKTTLFGSWRGI